MRGVAVACLVLFLALSGVNGTPARPRIPPVFTADFQFYMNINDGVPFSMDGTYQVDAFSEGMRWELQDFELPGYALNMTYIMGDEIGYCVTNGVCRYYSGTEYFPMFYFVPSAEYIGTAPLNGTDCDTWAVSYGQSSVSVSVLSSDVSRPVEVVYDFVTSEGSLFESFTFPINGMWEPMVVDDWAFDVPNRCYSDGGFLCPSGEVTTMEMVRFHAADDYDITNKNTADYLGDTTFLCTGLDTQNKNQVISLYDVEVNTRWGQYALCNNDVCVGGKNFTVGHEGSFGLPPLGGQCRTNSEYGNWYSLSGAARCNNTSVSNSTEGCAWREVAMKKSISLDCLVSVGFGDACEADGNTLPFSAATQSLYNALNYDDAADGGCPNMYNATTMAYDHNATNASSEGTRETLFGMREKVSSALQMTSTMLSVFL